MCINERLCVWPGMQSQKLAGQLLVPEIKLYAPPPPMCPIQPPLCISHPYRHAHSLLACVRDCRLQHVHPARAGPWEEEARRIEERARRMARNAESEAERAADRARSQTSQWASQDPDFVRERVTVWVQDQSNWSRLALPLLGTVGIALLFGMSLIVKCLRTETGDSDM
jgi:hypothetical protein